MDDPFGRITLCTESPRPRRASRYQTEKRQVPKIEGGKTQPQIPKKLVSKIPAVLKSTSSPGEKQEPGKNRFVAPLTLNSTFGRVGPGVRMHDITDGTSNTLMIVEASSDKSVTWTKPEDLTIDETDRLHSIIDQNSDGFAACMCDGSARMFSRRILPAALLGILSINGGEIIDLSNIE